MNKQEILEMKANELRIGNYIQWADGKIEVVNAIPNDKAIGMESDLPTDTYTPIELLEPIPLTEEWLLKFGFQKDFWNDGELFYMKDDFELEVGTGFYYIEMVMQLMQFINVRIYYVHQLQNLYFVLTGEELKTKIKNDKTRI